MHTVHLLCRDGLLDVLGQLDKLQLWLGSDLGWVGVEAEIGLGVVGIVLGRGGKAKCWRGAGEPAAVHTSKRMLPRGCS